MFLCEPAVNVDHIVYGKGLQIYVGDFLQDRFVVFKTKIPNTHRGQSPLLPFQIELTQTLHSYTGGEGRDNFETGGMIWNSTFHYAAKGKMDHARHEEAAQRLLDVAHRHQLVDEEGKNTGLSRMRFVHEVRFDQSFPSDASYFQGMKTDTKGPSPVEVYFGKNAGNRPLVELFSHARKSKLCDWSSGGNSLLHASFSLANGASSREAAAELLTMMKDARIQRMGDSELFMRADEYRQANQALLLGL